MWPNFAPQLPSVVAWPVAGGLGVADGFPRTGSPDVVEEGGLVGLAAEEAGAELGAAPVQPFWQPLAARQ